jgi:hypothetical protein
MFMDVAEECNTFMFTLKMEAVHAFEMSVNIYQTTQCSIAENSTILVTAGRASTLTTFSTVY